MKKHLRDMISANLRPEDLSHVQNTYDIVGDIAIIRLTKDTRKYAELISSSVMKAHKNVKTVLAQTGPVHGDFRLRRLEPIAGDCKTMTIHKESHCLFAVDVKECYFSPRLLHERMRIAKQIQIGEVLVNMFAGVGSFSIIAAKHSGLQKVYSLDVNPTAIQYAQKNARLNDVCGKVISLLGDAREIIENKLCNVADRVLMPLPEKALEYAPWALLALKDSRGWIHYYDFEYAGKGEDPVEKVKAKIAERFSSLGVPFDIPFGRVVRTVGPNWYQIVLDIKVG